MSKAIAAPKSFLQKLLDGVEVAGNKVPHPVVIFLGLIGIVIVLSHLLYLMGTTVTYQVIDPYTDKISEATSAANSLLTADGIRFIFTSVVSNFMSFNAVGVIIVAMVGVGVAEEAGLVKTLIRKLVLVSPPKALAYILVFVGILSSIASDAGYLVLIPLAAGACLSVGRHPMAGLAAAFAVAGLSGLIFLLLIISQFLAYFNYTNMATIAAVKLASVLTTANLPALVLLVGFVLVVAILDILITGAIPKWAIFAPIFVPLLMKLNVAPTSSWPPIASATRR